MDAIDEDRWTALVSQPGWYSHPELRPFLDALGQRGDGGAQRKQRVRDIFESRLLTGEVALAKTGPNMDAERKPIDTVVLHHTSNAASYRLSRLNAVHLLNLYVPIYRKRPPGTPIWSGHFDPDGHQVFYAYHWIVRANGDAERLLPDSAIGWHAGNWEVNCRSVAICFDGDLSKTRPCRAMLAATVRIIDRFYDRVPRDRIIGHRQANAKTACPGERFLSNWRADLLASLGRGPLQPPRTLNPVGGP